MKVSNKFVSMLIFTLAGCSAPGILASEPMGKQLERALKQIEEQCRASGAPPFGPNKPRTFETGCLMFTLKPWEIGDTPESAFAHSIKLPPPHDKPKDVYKPGMTSQEYFLALCKEEAGEWVFARIDEVRGIRQERSISRFPMGYASIVFYSKEKAGFGSAPEKAFVKPFGNYEFFELKQPANGSQPLPVSYIRFRSGVDRLSKLPEENITTPSAEFGYTWRGIRPRNDREHAIEGSELIVFKARPFMVLAYRREFTYYYLESNARILSAPNSAGCPFTAGQNAARILIESVLIPAK